MVADRPEVAGACAENFCFLHTSRFSCATTAQQRKTGLAVCRKHWFVAHSVRLISPRLSVSVIESCRRLGVPAKEYLLAVLPGMDRRKILEVAQLTPARWSARQ
jgi:hypothetical protein